MRRIASRPRDHWQSRVEEAGLTWHTPGQPYWEESACYEFSAAEADVLEAATGELEKLTRAAVRHVIAERLYARLGIPEIAVPVIESSWEAQAPSLYGRFDLAWTGDGAPKLLEYNADTPTSLLEAAVVQWFWLEDMHPGGNQFNSIHERLIERWKQLACGIPGGRIDFCSMEDIEDETTVAYLLDTAMQSGLRGSSFGIGEIGWDGTEFVGPDGERLSALFKLYPWEWMLREEFAAHLYRSRLVWLEPPWKAILSNKGILPILWQLYPGHPNLLEAGWSEPDAGRNWVRKPMLGREGANVTLHSADRCMETPGDYGAEGFVYQDLAPLRAFDGRYPVVGSWVVGNSSAGIGIRESETPITTDTSRFVPHRFD